MQPITEAIIRSPLGEIRAFHDEAGVLRVSVRADYGAAPADAETARAMQAATEMALDAIRALTQRSSLSAVRGTSSFNAWRAEHTIASPAVRTMATELYQNYLAFQIGCGDRPMTQRAFGQALGDLGFRVAGKNAQGQIYRGGLMLRPAEGSGPVAVAERA